MLGGTYVDYCPTYVSSEKHETLHIPQSDEKTSQRSTLREAAFPNWDAKRYAYSFLDVDF